MSLTTTDSTSQIHSLYLLPTNKSFPTAAHSAYFNTEEEQDQCFAKLLQIKEEEMGVWEMKRIREDDACKETGLEL